MESRHGGDFQRELEIIKEHVRPEVSDSNKDEQDGDPEWLSLPEIPSAEVFNPNWQDPSHLDQMNSLLPNNWQTPWTSKDTYLETHYRLQREEAVTMLRFSVKKYREAPTMGDDDETCVYTKVFVQGYLMTRLGPMCRVQFSLERAEKRVRWTQTKRLQGGKLVLLSTAQDGFKTICIPAVVADRSIEGLDHNPPTIQLHWADVNDAILDPTLELVMLESRNGYFEGIRHSMLGLQHVARSETALDKYLVQADKSEGDAQYVVENPRFNLMSLVHHIPDSQSMRQEEVERLMMEKKRSMREFDMLKRDPIELAHYTNLDNSQLDAAQRMLTKELAIVQGPPGTGKTFTSVESLQIMIDSQAGRERKVIVVAAQTNHAVDQMLNQLIKRKVNVVRLGGRTQHDTVMKYTLYHLRKHVRAFVAPNIDRDHRSVEGALKNNVTQLEHVVSSIFPEEMLSPKELNEAGLISREQMQSLEIETGWAPDSEPSESSARPEPISMWLGEQRVRAQQMDYKDPVFEQQETDETADFDEEDFDIEQDDLAAVDDDDGRDKVWGKWVPLKHYWTGSNPRGYTENSLKLKKELKRADLYETDPACRGAMYQYWQREMLHHRLSRFREILAAAVRISKNLKISRWYRDVRCIQAGGIEVIGCTTTGLCKYRGLLAALQPRTMLIEEAAETKEANILSAIYPSLQQLILVGDHQQLAPQCDTPMLAAGPYYLRVSMFERLVKLDMPFTMLNMQRRMNPLLRQVLNPFYPALRDHPVVTKPNARPPIPGMAIESYFFDHIWSESTDENLSKFNEMESEMIIHFIDYLLMNGVDPAKITVLTFYRGQKKRILLDFRKTLKHRQPFKNVQTVDSYQGEENDIILLSLVRSNGLYGPHRAGFLKDSNRAVVAISRARCGFYIFGNMTNLANACTESRDLWGKVEKVFREQGRFGSERKLPITCQKHQRTTWITHPNDWVNHHGGCAQKCTDKLDCGHDCGRSCHWIPHEKLICQAPCEKTLRCGHPCQKICGDLCYCNCPDFSGAFPNDERWDNTSDTSTTHWPIEQEHYASPFVGRDGRVGQIRRGQNARRGMVVRQPKVANPLRPEPIRPRQRGDLGTGDISTSAWHNYTPKNLVELPRQASFQPTSGRASNGLPGFASATSTTSGMINPIRDTFYRVELKDNGHRDDVKEKSVSIHSHTPSPDSIRKQSPAKSHKHSTSARLLGSGVSEQNSSTSRGHQQGINTYPVPSHAVNEATNRLSALDIFHFEPEQWYKHEENTSQVVNSRLALVEDDDASEWEVAASSGAMKTLDGAGDHAQHTVDDLLHFEDTIEISSVYKDSGAVTQEIGASSAFTLAESGSGIIDEAGASSVMNSIGVGAESSSEDDLLSFD
ncbi:P-loop containing nucleoside triphosphate hydrolase protein [Xylariaceae sp. FL1019]|nr:P-loop containing nucleoside triphosphate hydrolase protein [Xylariaceae sp. FL1019]